MSLKMALMLSLVSEGEADSISILVIGDDPLVNRLISDSASLAGYL